MRLSQSLFPSNCMALMCYVDDPLAVIKGTPQERRLYASMLMYVWRALGLPLAFRKGQFGSEIAWIGGLFRVDSTGVTASIKQDIIDDINSDLLRFGSANVISLKELHSFCGKTNNAAGLLVVLRPFLHPLWAALYAPASGASPAGTVWTKQLEPTFAWLRAFFQGTVGGITRRFDLAAYLREGPQVEIGTDASPFGLGGWLTVDGVIVKHFSCPVQDEDVEIFGVQRGSHVGQQIWESLAILVGLRLWLPLWSNQRVCLRVRGDNVGALMLLIKMRPRTPSHAIIAREIALLTIEMPFQPDVEHTPGVAHVVADGLSRCFNTLGAETLYQHAALATSVRTEVPIRHRSWYRALANTAAQKGGDGHLP
jgi:hypothetical protein